MAEVFERITMTIVTQLETSSPGDWICPWHRRGGGMPRNAETGRSYRGINILSLWCAAQTSGFDASEWATYRQWEAIGAQVRKGERGTPVMFFRELPCDEHAAADEGDRRIVARTSYVFNAAQVDGLAPKELYTPNPLEEMFAFDEFVTSTGAAIQFGHPAPCYIPSADEIRMPERGSFLSAGGYQATLAHELVHWTGAPSRLARDLSQRFGSQGYAAEELVAELGSAFVLASLGLSSEPHPQHAAYIASWLPLLRKDARALMIAASAASRATDFLLPQAGDPERPSPPLVKATQPASRTIASRRRPRREDYIRGTRLHLNGW